MTTIRKTPRAGANSRGTDTHKEMDTMHQDSTDYAEFQMAQRTLFDLMPEAVNGD